MENKLTFELILSSMLKTAKNIVRSFYKIVKNILFLLFSLVFIVLFAIYKFFETIILWVDNKVVALAAKVNPKWFVYFIIILIVVLFVLLFLMTKAKAAESHSFDSFISEQVSEVRPAMEFNLDVLAQALIHVESQGNDNAISDTSSASGPLQELNVFVDEANRLSNLYNLGVHYDYSDRFDRQKAVDMFMIVQRHHNPENSFVRAVTIHRGFFSKDYYAAVGEKYDDLMHDLGYDGTYTELN